jgi:hypothetical protein
MCAMQGTDATKINSEALCEKGTVGTTDGICQGRTVVSGPSVCITNSTKLQCQVSDYVWEPTGMTWGVAVESATTCQQLCWGDLSCQKFSYFTNGTCTFQAHDATPVPTTASVGVISGAQACGPLWYNLYPDITVESVAPPSPGPFLGTNDTGGKKGSFPWPWIILFLALLSILVAVSMYGSGMCDKDKKKKKKKGKTPSRRNLTGDTPQMADRATPLVEEKPLPTSAEAVPAYTPVPQVVTGSPVAGGQASGTFTTSGRQVVSVGTPVQYQPYQQVSQAAPVVMQAVPQQQQGLFEMLDTNNDGRVSAAEWNAAQLR